MTIYRSRISDIPHSYETHWHVLCLFLRQYVYNLKGISIQQTRSQSEITTVNNCSLQVHHTIHALPCYPPNPARTRECMKPPSEPTKSPQPSHPFLPASTYLSIKPPIDRPAATDRPPPPHLPRPEPPFDRKRAKGIELLNSLFQNTGETANQTIGVCPGPCPSVCTAVLGYFT